MIEVFDAMERKRFDFTGGHTHGPALVLRFRARIATALVARDWAQVAEVFNAHELGIMLHMQSASGFTVLDSVTLVRK